MSYAGSDQDEVVGSWRRHPWNGAQPDAAEPDSWRLRGAGRQVLSKVLGGVGVVLLLAGLAFALRGIQVDNIDCGSVLSPDKGITPMQCDNQLDRRGTIVAGLAVGGVAIALGGFALGAVRERRAEVGS
ncbi:hypothetical protein HPO96_06270 [Kribbella sandramycini]|uniref:Uncharacterized protein n=1 Tax=Kribbella sandramycini TaxID=60450 RepID=A0A7Y4NZC1_9ACTN|nr:hypothetical protein [Kribbella sandramycini]MBB6567552.1 hypothetical protein [Kribbella sandramycini]NOL39844.1 hypothetical protein [Kribbella sandramycini]